MQCPVCELDQVIVEWDDVELDLCIDGHGIWFDADELRQLLTAAGAPEALRCLESRLGASWAASPLACPRCGAAMQRVRVDDGDRPLLDRCPHAHGLWFDGNDLARLVEVDADDTDLAAVREHLLGFTRPLRGEEEHAT